jgi:hypothetical protein
MAKSKGSKGGISKGGAGSWSHEEQCARVKKKVSSLKRRQGKKSGSSSTITNDNEKDEMIKTTSYKRTALAHDTQDQIDTKKLVLHLSHLHREIDKLRQTLTHWDEEEQQNRLMPQESKRQQQQEAESRPRTLAEKAARKRQKMDPSNWKLRGAARPAWEVYDFDTRYVCPHTLEQERHRERTKRLVNLLVLYRGQFGREGLPTVCRTFLSLLMQYGTLCVEAKRFRSAREAFLECIELEGSSHTATSTTPTTTTSLSNTYTSITNARCRLMRMYIDQKRLDSARTLLDKTITYHDCSAWITYGASIVRYISWKESQVTASSSESGGDGITTTNEVSNEIITQQTLRRALESNIFLAYYLAFYDTFTTTMEYTQDVIEDAEPGTLEEAIEYCSSEQMNLWIKTEGAMEWIRSRLLYERKTSSKLHDWDKLLQQAEISATTTTTIQGIKETDLFHEASEESAESAVTINDDDANVRSISEHIIDQSEEVDLKMYINMFRTAMEIIEDSGMLM